MLALFGFAYASIASSSQEMKRNQQQLLDEWFTTSNHTP